MKHTDHTKTYTFLPLLWLIVCGKPVDGRVILTILPTPTPTREFIHCQWKPYECESADRTDPRWGENCFEGAAGAGSCYDLCRGDPVSRSCEGYCQKYLSTCRATESPSILPYTAESLQIISSTTPEAPAATSDRPDSAKPNHKPAKRPAADKLDSERTRENFGEHRVETANRPSMYKHAFFISLCINLLFIVGGVSIFCYFRCSCRRCISFPRPSITWAEGCARFLRSPRTADGSRLAQSPADKKVDDHGQAAAMQPLVSKQISDGQLATMSGWPKPASIKRDGYIEAD